MIRGDEMSDYDIVPDNNKISELRTFLTEAGSAPTLEEMKRRSLREKGIDGPTGAHVIEEIHTPFNFAYVTATTGTTAFQNLVGVTHQEIPGRIKAAHRLFSLASLKKGCHMLITYPPLVSVFSKQALDSLDVTTGFLLRSERAALLLAAWEQKPDVIVGESSFLKAALIDAKNMDMLDLFPKGITFLAAGTPLDLELPELAAQLVQGSVHDLYGCQEFGFLTLDGIPLRDDLTLLKWKDPYHDLLVGGLPTGDCFPVSETGHLCNRKGTILTYSRKRKDTDCEVTVKAAPVSGIDTLFRLSKTILRIKARIIRVDPDVTLDADMTSLFLSNQDGEQKTLTGPAATELFDCLLRAQTNYQATGKRDPAWLKGR